MTFEEKIRDLAARGELSHLSLCVAPTSKQWRASFVQASAAGGVHYGQDADPVKAIMLAFNHATKLARMSRTESEFG